MALLFALRGDSLTPRYAKGGKEYSTFLGGSTLAVPPVPVALADPSCFGGYAIQSNTAAGDYREWYYSAKGNWVRGTRTFSMLVRAATTYSGTPPNDINLMRVGEPRSNTVYGGARIWLQDNNTALFMAQPKNGLSNHLLTAPSLAGNPLVAGVFKDYMLTANDATGKWYASIDGVQVGTGDLAGDGNGAWDFDSLVAPSIVFGTWPFQGWINEALIWDTCEPHVYSPRTGWLACADFDGTTYSDPGVSNVKNGTSYTHAGVAKVGTANIPQVGDVRLGVATGSGTGTLRVPTQSQVKTGILFDEDDSMVGLYNGNDRWSDPGQANVREGVGYLANNVNKTGTCAVPDPSDVRYQTPVDDTEGELTLPVAADVRLGTSFAGTVGELIVPPANETKLGTPVGNNGVGSYTATERYTDFGNANIRAGTAGKYNSTVNNRLGTMQVVTNTFQELVLDGQGVEELILEVSE